MPRRSTAALLMLLWAACTPQPAPAPAPVPASGPAAVAAPPSVPVAAPAAVPAAACAELHLDLVRGTLNGIPPTVSMDEVKRRLPCFTGETEETSNINRGGGVFYVNHDFYFYTGGNHIEVRGRFPGTVTPNVLRRPIADAQRLLGPHARTLERNGSLLFRAPYGCVVVRLSRDGAHTVEEVAAYAMLCEFVPDEA